MQKCAIIQLSYTEIKSHNTRLKSATVLRCDDKGNSKVFFMKQKVNYIVNK